MKCDVKNKIKLGKIKVNNKIYERCRWIITNPHLKQSLINLGVVPNKSLILTFPNLNLFSSNELIKHFIRGYWDGDGCLTYSNLFEKKFPEISVIGTEDFLTELKNNLPLEFDYKLSSKANTIVKTLHIGGKNAFKLAYYLYENSNIYLERKYQRYLEFCRLYKELYKELSGNIGEIPEKENPEINSEIKESESSYSVESEHCVYEKSLTEDDMCISSICPQICKKYRL